MKKYEIVISSAAEDDLNNVHEHISQDDPVAADRTVDGIIKSLRRLETFPLSSPLVPDEELSREMYRVLRCGNYLCFYRIVGTSIHVYRVIHGAREYSVLLNFEKGF